MARASGMPLGDTKVSGFSRESAQDGSAIQRILQS